jgi:hypothetical protein
MGFDASEPTSIGASAVLGVGAARLGVDAGGRREGRWGKREGGGEGRRRSTEQGKAARKSIRAACKVEVDVCAREREGGLEYGNREHHALKQMIGCNILTGGRERGADAEGGRDAASRGRCSPSRSRGR